ncbi:MAG: sensor histidine kinase [Spirochaetaceae bacterium]|nr:MAG: sensor histidine kinase [Spirochaetaceae bacterium]
MEAALLETEISFKQRKEALHELHHRVKNNLQLVVSMLRLSQSTTESKPGCDELVSGIMRGTLRPGAQ